MYRVSKPKGSLSNVTITNEETTSSAVLGRFNSKHKIIFDKYDIILPDNREEWSFEVKDEVGKELAMSCLTGHKPARAKIQKNEQIVPDESKSKPDKKFSAYNYLFGYTDEIE
jgi:hypothetical protein